MAKIEKKICANCIFLSDCKGILLDDNQCRFYLEQSDVDMDIVESRPENRIAGMNQLNWDIPSKN